MSDYDRKLIREALMLAREEWRRLAMQTSAREMQGILTRKADRVAYVLREIGDERAAHPSF